jgi:hypothetical protein
MYTSRRQLFIRGVLAAVCSLPAIAFAQQSTRPGPATRDGEPRLQGGINFTVAQPAGQFSQYVDNGIGVGVHGLARLGNSGWFALRLDGDFIQYGRETTRVPLSNTVGGRILVDLTTSNNIVSLGFGPQLMVPRGPFRPYVNGSVGFSYFSTESSVSGIDDDESLLRNTNFDDHTFSYAGGTGVLVPVFRNARSIVFIDVGARFHNNGRAQYLREGGIEDQPDGSVLLHPIASTANLWTYHLGVSIGGR